MRLLKIALLIALFISYSSVLAFETYRDRWRVIYPNSNADDIGGSAIADENGCQVCHRDVEGGSPWNSYGWQIRDLIRNENESIDEAIDSVEFDNLDGNSIGATSLDQIIANFQPGWAVGNVNTIYFSNGSTATNQPSPATPSSTGIDFPASTITNPVADITSGTISARLVEVATNFNAPLRGVTAPGINGSMFVVEQTGKIFRVELSTGNKTLFHDVGPDLVPISPSYDERGLLGLAFHPNYQSNGLFYTYQSEPARDSQDDDVDFSTDELGRAPSLAHRSMVVEYRAVDASCNSRIQKRDTLMIIDQPQNNHNGGDLAFDPDGYLYISLGDGGAANDQGPGHNLGGNSRDNSNVLGSILRIDPLGNNSLNAKYGIPGDNPFIAAGDQGVDEIFAYGFRNPFRISFDAVTGELYTGDVGQNQIEEVDVVVSGGNYGWNWKEGSFNFYNPGPDSGTYLSNVGAPGLPNDVIDPIAEYDHDDGISVTGGFVYRGSEIPELANHYVFGDFSGSNFSTATGRLFHQNRANSQLREFILAMPLVGYVTGFGQDVENELYVVVNNQPNPGGQEGKLLRLADTSTSVSYPSADGESAMCPPAVQGDELCFPIPTNKGSTAVICL
ncbi:MAG: glucose/arabinose dehydrogenase [Chitinophagales bacterium]|jgi:glucose/arabinose dehydrogenase